MGQSVYTRILTCGGGDQFTDIFVVVIVVVVGLLRMTQLTRNSQ